MCWHRPGRLIRTTRTCRNCGVAIEQCPCVNYFRTPDPFCYCCFASGWVALVRGYRTKLLDLTGIGHAEKNAMLR
jgi:hypothetical protein